MTQSLVSFYYCEFKNFIIQGQEVVKYDFFSTKASFENFDFYSKLLISHDFCFLKFDTYFHKYKYVVNSFQNNLNRLNTMGKNPNKTRDKIHN